MVVITTMKNQTNCPLGNSINPHQLSLKGRTLAVLSIGFKSEMPHSGTVLDGPVSAGFIASPTCVETSYLILKLYGTAFFIGPNKT